jgi:hypothetical protein
MTGKIVEFVKIIVPRCANTYGVAPCTAATPPKCFNCLATCQDTPNFVETTADLLFAKPADYLTDAGINHIGAWIKSTEHTSAAISLAENLGTRAVLRVVLEDRPHSDAGEGLDKYQGERGYDPYARGTFWPRFRARYPSPNGFELVWYIGEVGQSLEEMESRSFFVESFSGPAADGSFTITAKDALKFLDGDRAQIPRLSGGFLSADIDDNDTSITLSPAGIGDAEYTSAGAVRVGGKEDIEFTRVGDVLTLTTRAIFGSVASSHSAGDRVQLHKIYSSQKATTIIADAITSFTDLDPSRIPLAEWELEDDTNLGTLYTFNLGEPQSVSGFVSRLLEQCSSMMWDDALAGLLRFKVIRAVPAAADVISEANVIARTFEPTDQPDQRVSRAWVYYGLSNWTKKRDDLDNYRQTVIAPDEEIAEENEALYGAQAIKKIFADGIAIGGGAVAERAGLLLVGRKQRPPRRFKWSMLRAENLPQLGGGYFLDWRSLQDASGARDPVPVQVISDKVSSTVHQYLAEEMRFTDLDTGSSTDRVILINFNGFNLNLRAIHNLTYPSTFDGVTVTFIISSIIGSTHTAFPAVDVGDWPLGFVPKIKMQGRIQGKGGDGGAGNPAAGSAGNDGGVALYTRHNIDLELDVGDAEIWGGGGGGGGGSGGFLPGGGGGGAGTNAGAGGPGAFGGATGSPGTSEAGGAGGVGAPSSGGDGGGPGLNGTAGLGAGGTGGAAGAAIDGDSYVTITAGTGDIRGPQIN